MKIAIRLDDITPNMDFQKFYKMKLILDSYQVKPLIGVVPFNEDSNLAHEEIHQDFDEFLRQLVKEGWTVALHGYRHLYVNKKAGLFPLNHDSEFAGLSLEEQSRMMKAGLEQLKKWGVETDLFMAPSHSYDRKTLLAMKKNGLMNLTDGFGNWPYKREGITFYPISKKRSDCLSDKDGYTTLVLHTNTMDEREFREFNDLLQNCKNNLISFSDYLMVEAKNRTFFGNIQEYILATIKHYMVKLLIIFRR